MAWEGHSERASYAWPLRRRLGPHECGRAQTRQCWATIGNAMHKCCIRTLWSVMHKQGPGFQRLQRLVSQFRVCSLGVKLCPRHCLTLVNVVDCLSGQRRRAVVRRGRGAWPIRVDAMKRHRKKRRSKGCCIRFSRSPLSRCAVAILVA